MILRFCLFLVTWGTFVSCLENGFVNSDDQEYVYANPHVLSGLSVQNLIWAFSRSTGANWHPLTMISHILDSQVYGLHPWGHHLTSIIIHSLNCMLVFALLERATGRIWRSFWVALLFGIHPLRVESVAWISERKDVLSTLFGMLALLAYVSYAAEVGTEGKRRRHFSLAALWFLLGLMSKPMLVTLPFLLLLLDFWPLQRWNSVGAFQLIKEKTAFFFLSAIFSVVTLFTQNRALYPVQFLSYSLRLQTAVISYCRYLAKIFYPVQLAAYYPYPVHWPISRVIVSVVLLVACTALIVPFWRKCPAALTGWCWFLGVLLPVIGLAQVGSQSMADRYTYLPSVGIFILLVWGLCDVGEYFRIPVPVIVVIGIISVSICSVCTRHQIAYWKDGETLFRHALAVTENNYVAHTLVGYDDIAETNYDAATAHFREAIRIKNDTAGAWTGWGIVLTREGQLAEAIDKLRVGVLLDTNSAKAHKELAVALLASGKRDEAITNFQCAVNLQPGDSGALVELCRLTNSEPVRDNHAK